MNLCKFKDFFGKPNTGLHSMRVFNIAIVDVLLTVLLAYLIANTIHTRFYVTLATLFISGIILHRIFCVKTTIDKLLF
jgi:hypothetical protein